MKLTKDLLAGVWLGAVGTEDEPGAIELVLLPDGTGYYDEEHNYCMPLGEIKWCLTEDGKLDAVFVNKHDEDNVRNYMRSFGLR